MSVKIDLYNAIKTRLETVSSLRNVLHYNGQDLFNYEKEHARRFPQAWVQLTSTTWKPSELEAYNKNRTRQQKSDQCIISIYSATFSLDDDDDTFETDLILIDDIYRAITLLDGSNFTALERINEEDSPTNNNVRVWLQQYSTMLTEQAVAGTLEDVAPVDLTIDKTILP